MLFPLGTLVDLLFNCSVESVEQAVGLAKFGTARTGGGAKTDFREDREWLVVLGGSGSEILTWLILSQIWRVYLLIFAIVHAASMAVRRVPLS